MHSEASQAKITGETNLTSPAGIRSRTKPVWMDKEGALSINAYLEELEAQIRGELVDPWASPFARNH